MMGKQGFASMSKDRVREIASMGGKAAHAMGKAREWTSKEAQEAGRKGGLARAAQLRAEEDARLASLESK
jgi:general stress protein YciG